jgi:GT2 family glycosyltransferase
MKSVDISRHLVLVGLDLYSVRYMIFAHNGRENRKENRLYVYFRMHCELLSHVEYIYIYIYIYIYMHIFDYCFRYVELKF